MTKLVCICVCFVNMVSSTLLVTTALHRSDINVTELHRR